MDTTTITPHLFANISLIKIVTTYIIKEFYLMNHTYFDNTKVKSESFSKQLFTMIVVLIRTRRCEVTQMPLQKIINLIKMDNYICCLLYSVLAATTDTDNAINGSITKSSKQRHQYHSPHIHYIIEVAI